MKELLFPRYLERYLRIDSRMMLLNIDGKGYKDSCRSLWVILCCRRGVKFWRVSCRVSLRPFDDGFVREWEANEILCFRSELG